MPSLYPLLYRLGLTPWEDNDDTGPLTQILTTRPPGRALDAGCGTGRHAVTLAKQRWMVIGIDSAPNAIARALERSTKAGVTDLATFVVGDVTRIDEALPDAGLDLILDLGCFHGLKPTQRQLFAAAITRRSGPGTIVLLHVVGPRRGLGPRGVADEEIASVFGADWDLSSAPSGTFGGGPLRGVPFRWVTLTKQRPETQVGTSPTGSKDER